MGFGEQIERDYIILPQDYGVVVICIEQPFTVMA